MKRKKNPIILPVGILDCLSAEGLELHLDVLTQHIMNHGVAKKVVKNFFHATIALYEKAKEEMEMQNQSVN
ncbi:MAG: hypothetical protein KBT33_01635 [Prevotellaceae bacterium]|nr:hypothetical protein [Candidatus Minthosoma equi]